MKIGIPQNLSTHCHIGLDPVDNLSPYHRPEFKANYQALAESCANKKYTILHNIT